MYKKKPAKHQVVVLALFSFFFTIISSQFVFLVPAYAAVNSVRYEIVNAHDDPSQPCFDYFGAETADRALVIRVEHDNGGSVTSYYCPEVVDESGGNFTFGIDTSPGNPAVFEPGTTNPLSNAYVRGQDPENVRFGTSGQNNIYQQNGVNTGPFNSFFPNAGSGEGSAADDVTDAASGSGGLVNEDGNVVDQDGNVVSTAPQSCEEVQGIELSFFLCPLLRGIDNSLEQLDRSINAVLRVPNEYFQGTSGENLEKTWTRLRNLAYFILVPIALVMVISTALGFEFFSAYTIKKALPRFLLAVVFIALSFEITKLGIQVTNDLGNGVGGLITNAFSASNGGDITLASLFNPSHSQSAVAGIGLVGIIIALAATNLLWAALVAFLFFALLALLGLLIGFLVLVLRQMLLIFLMILAPLAILSWIFPGNDKLWGLWKGSFVNLLLLYPLITALIAVGKSFAIILDTVATPAVSFINTSGFASIGLAQGSLFAQAVDGQLGFFTGLVLPLMKLIVYVAPYFFIPAAFKYAGGAFSNLTGMINNRQKGAFDRLRARGTRTWKENRGFDKQLQEKSRGQKIQNKRFEELGDPGKNRLTRGVRRVRNRGISDDVARLARAENSKNQLQQASYALETGNIDVAGEEFEIRDKHNNVVRSGLDKRQALVAASQGQRIFNRDKEIADGNSGAMRAATNKLASQGDITGLRDVQQQQAANTYGLSQTENFEVSQAFSEAIQANFPTINQKAPDIAKGGAGNAFGEIKAEDMVTWDKSTVSAAVQYLDTTMHPEATKQRELFNDALDTLLNDPKRYGAMSGDARARLHAELSALPTGGNLGRAKTTVIAGSTGGKRVTSDGAVVS